MNVEEARNIIQKAIDDVNITSVEKRQLFGLYQNLANSTKLTNEVERLIVSICSKYVEIK